MLLEADVFKNRRRLMIELGGPDDVGCVLWLSEELDALDLGCVVVVVISLPIDVRPDSELALQFPLDECGSSFVAKPIRRCRRRAVGSRIFTGIADIVALPACAATTDGRPEPIDALRSDEEYDGFRSCESRRSLSFIFFCRLFIASKTLKSSMSSAFGLCLKLLRVVSSLVLLNLLIIRNRLFPHCFSELKCDDERFTSAANESFFSTSLDLLLGTIVISFSRLNDISPLSSAWLKLNYYG